MQFSSIIRTIQRSPLTNELLSKLEQHHEFQLNGVGRFPKGLVASALAQQRQEHLLVITATLEEAGRWATQLEAMGWNTVNFYPTSEASPYDSFRRDTALPCPEVPEELTWGQMQVLSDLFKVRNSQPGNGEPSSTYGKKIAIVSTERSLQTHLPPVDKFSDYWLTFQLGMSWSSKTLDRTLAKLGYDRVALVETEGQWSRRGDIVDIFPVAAELPVRLEWFGDELEKMREFDPSTQRSLDKIDQLILTPTSFSAIVLDNLPEDFNLEEWETEAIPPTPLQKGGEESPPTPLKKGGERIPPNPP
jgi:transcription-repair coupling factor (superfamily II helicase)